MFLIRKVAYPDLVGGDGRDRVEPLNNKDRRVCRSKLLTSVDRGLHSGAPMQETVYDLDALVAAQQILKNGNDQRLLCNWDETRIDKTFVEHRQLQFESRFESGNLRKVIQVNIIIVIKINTFIFTVYYEHVAYIITMTVDRLARGSTT